MRTWERDIKFEKNWIFSNRSGCVKLTLLMVTNIMALFRLQQFAEMQRSKCSVRWQLLANCSKIVVMLLRDTLSSMLSTANCWKHGRMAVKSLRFCCARCVTAWTEHVLYVVNNVTERLSALVAATSAILLLNASKLLPIVGNGTHPITAQIRILVASKLVKSSFFCMYFLGKTSQNISVVRGPVHD